MAPCSLCPPSSPRRALLRRPKTLQAVCKECFFDVFETEIHHTVMGYGQAEHAPHGEQPPKSLFARGERVAIGASGGKGASMPSLCCACGVYRAGQGRAGRRASGSETRCPLLLVVVEGAVQVFG